MAEGIQLRLTHGQRTLPSPPYKANTRRTTSIYVDDIRESEHQRGLNLPPAYVPYGVLGTPGFVDLTFTSLVARSFESGDIRRLIDTGEITFEFFIGGEFQRAAKGVVTLLGVAGAPSPDTYTAGADESLFLVDTVNDPLTIQLPSGDDHASGFLRVVDIGGNAGANNILINAAAGETIGGIATYTMASNRASDEFIWNTLTQNWVDVIPAGANPTGVAGGDLGGNYPNPTVTAITETGGPTQLVVGAVANGQYLQRAGGTVIGVAPPGGLTIAAAAFPGPYNSSNTQFVEANAAGGPFTVNLPNPGVAGDRIVVKKVDGTANAVTIDSNGGPNIDGAATATLNIQYESLTVIRGTAQWWVE